MVVPYKSLYLPGGRETLYCVVEEGFTIANPLVKSRMYTFCEG
jgi:hypothetical protein